MIILLKEAYTCDGICGLAMLGVEKLEKGVLYIIFKFHIRGRLWWEKLDCF